MEKLKVFRGGLADILIKPASGLILYRQCGLVHGFITHLSQHITRNARLSAGFEFEGTSEVHINSSPSEAEKIITPANCARDSGWNDYRIRFCGYKGKSIFGLNQSFQDAGFLQAQ